MRHLLLAFGLSAICFCQSGMYSNFQAWRSEPENSTLNWETATKKFEKKLRAEGFTDAEIKKAISIINSRDEAELYDPIFNAIPQFQTSPSSLLIEAAKNHPPGQALDVGMGQGRNSIYLATLGWNVTGFDVSKVGLAEATKQATAVGVNINGILASDEEFDFGTAQWDLIAILYPIEKRSVYRVREALKLGGIVVVECGHKEAGNAPFEYETNELLKIFQGFRILKYEDGIGIHEWAGKQLRLVRLIAQKL